MGLYLCHSRLLAPFKLVPNRSLPPIFLRSSPRATSPLQTVMYMIRNADQSRLLRVRHCKSKVAYGKSNHLRLAGSSLATILPKLSLPIFHIILCDSLLGSSKTERASRVPIITHSTAASNSLHTWRGPGSFPGSCCFTDTCRWCQSGMWLHHAFLVAERDPSHVRVSLAPRGRRQAPTEAKVQDILRGADPGQELSSSVQNDIRAKRHQRGKTSERTDIQ